MYTRKPLILSLGIMALLPLLSCVSQSVGPDGIHQKAGPYEQSVGPGGVKQGGPGAHQEVDKDGVRQGTR